MTGKSLDAIQRAANEYAETVLRYYRADSPDLPALPNPEATCYETVEFWLDSQWDMPKEIRSQVAGAAIGHAREVVAVDWGDDVILYLKEN